MLVIIAAITTVVPAIKIAGFPPRMVDPVWIEGLATAWALVGALFIVRIEVNRDRERYLLDVAAAYVTWSLDSVRNGSAGMVTTLHVNNYGRFPITDAHVHQGEPRDASTDEVTVPVPIAPGGSANIVGGDGLNDGPFTLYFTAMANGHRYRRWPDGRLDDLGLAGN